MKHTIYLADDEKNIRDLIQSFLESDGYEVQTFSNGDDLLAHFQKKPCDLVILDIMMPGTDGLTICQELRKITSVPIIMLTAKDTELDYVRGITVGSDDYLTKPFKPTVLLMRVHALLRRVEMDTVTQSPHKPDSEAIAFADLLFSPERNEITCQGTPLPLTQTELKLLSYMLRNNQKSFSREELLETIWGYDTEVETRVTDETLRRIRKKMMLAHSNVQVQTIWGFGYKLTIREGQ